MTLLIYSDQSGGYCKNYSKGHTNVRADMAPEKWHIVYCLCLQGGPVPAGREGLCMQGGPEGRGTAQAIQIRSSFDER